MTKMAVHSAPSPSQNDERCSEALRIASELFALKPDWLTFFREVLGVNGVVRRLFPTVVELSRFESSAQYSEIQEMVRDLREKGKLVETAPAREATRVITVRLPQTLHQALRAEAQNRKTSINQLCIRKLLQLMDETYQSEPQKEESGSLSK